MKIEYDEISNPGGRPINEDAYVIVRSENMITFAVADGLGGHGNGEIASSIAVSAVGDTFKRYNGESQKTKVTIAFEEAQKRILGQQEALNIKNSMKTTLCVLSIEAGCAFWGHIGDSRIYWFRGHKLFKRTLDHSVPQMLVATGDIKESEIRYHEDRNRLLRVIGTEWSKPEYELAEQPVRLRPNDKFLICSDGFWENVDEKEMAECMSKAKNATDWLIYMRRILLRKTKNKDNDNFTAITVWIK